MTSRRNASKIGRAHGRIYDGKSFGVIIRLVYASNYGPVGLWEKEAQVLFFDGFHLFESIPPVAVINKTRRRLQWDRKAKGRVVHAFSVRILIDSYLLLYAHKHTHTRTHVRNTYIWIPKRDNVAEIALSLVLPRKRRLAPETLINHKRFWWHVRRRSLLGLQLKKRSKTISIRQTTRTIC